MTKVKKRRWNVETSREKESPPTTRRTVTAERQLLAGALRQLTWALLFSGLEPWLTREVLVRSWPGKAGALVSTQLGIPELEGVLNVGN